MIRANDPGEWPWRMIRPLMAFSGRASCLLVPGLPSAGHPTPPMPRLLPLLLALALGLFACGGDDDGESSGEGEGSGEEQGPRHGLTAEQASELLVKVGDAEITVGEFAERLADQSPYLRARYNSPERRREFLNNLIRFELLAAEARRRGLDELPEVERTRKQTMIQQMMKDLFEDRIRLSDVTDEEIRAYYEEHEDEFNKPAQVRASHILIADRATAERVLAEVRANERDMAIFSRLAQRHSEDEETRRGSRNGDLRFFGRDGSRGGDTDEAPVPAPLAEAAFSIERIGGVYPELVQTDAGFHIVKLTGRRAALRRTLEEARRPIQNRLWRQKREDAVEEFVAGLREEAEVEENLGALDSVRIDLGPENVAAVPEGAPADALEVPETTMGATGMAPSAMAASMAPSTMAPATMAPANMESDQ